LAPRIVFRAEFFREADLYIGLAPELGVSSFGESLEEAKRSLEEATQAFVEEGEAMGTLEGGPQSGGFRSGRGSLSPSRASGHLASLR